MVKSKKFSEVPPLWFEVACIEDNKMWFVAITGNQLFELNLLSGETKLLGSLSHETVDSVGLIGSIVKDKNRLILAPYNGRYFHEYDLIKNKFEKFSNPAYGKGKFFSGKKVGDSIYFIGTFYPLIAKFNLITREVESFSDFSQEIYKRGISKNEQIFRDTALVQGNKLLIPGLKSNFVLEFDIKSKEHKIIDIKGEEDGFNTILDSKKGFYLITRTGIRVLHWNGKTNDLEIILDYSNKNTDNRYEFIYSVKYKHKIILFNSLNSNGVIIDENTNQTSFFNELISIDENYRMNLIVEKKPLWVGICEDDLYYLSTYGCKLYKINLNNFESKVFDLRLSSADMEKYLKESISAETVMTEGTPYINPENIFKFDFSNKGGFKEVASNGSIIYNEIKNIIR